MTAPAGWRPGPGGIQHPVTPPLPRQAGARLPRRAPAVTFLTVAEVADRMRVSKMTVYRLIHAGELRAVRIGRSFRVPEPAVDAYLGEAAVAQP